MPVALGMLLVGELFLSPYAHPGVLVRGAWLVLVLSLGSTLSAPKTGDEILKQLPSQKPDPFLLRAVPVPPASFPFGSVLLLLSLKQPPQ